MIKATLYVGKEGALEYYSLGISGDKEGSETLFYRNVTDTNRPDIIRSVADEFTKIIVGLSPEGIEELNMKNGYKIDENGQVCQIETIQNIGLEGKIRLKLVDLLGGRYESKQGVGLQ